ncbi:tripartite motif-containing protein 43-like, partial [Perognathus longimembris pacificus]|uniref:tripartite motif-containing protein 43-like n=1 Tax=Perognathus longimembris pacificus TaxID=214514 RepID=UPI002018550E
MDMDIMQAFQEGLSCVICLNTIIDPVTIVCGHTFCRPCLYLAWEKAYIPARCPVCRAPSKWTNLKTNIKMKHMVSIARKARLQQFLSSEEHRCETHQEPKQVFCEVESTLLCKLCSQSPEHQAHEYRRSNKNMFDILLPQLQEEAKKHSERLIKENRVTLQRLKATKRCESLLVYMPHLRNPRLRALPISGLMDEL